MTSSTIRPDNYRIQGDSVYFIDNIIEKTNIDDDGITTVTYEYDEYKLDLCCRKNMSNYVSNNYESLFKFVKEKQILDKMNLTEEEVEHAKLEIEILSILGKDYNMDNIHTRLVHAYMILVLAKEIEMKDVPEELREDVEIAKAKHEISILS